MAEEAGKTTFTFLDDNGKPVENKKEEVIEEVVEEVVEVVEETPETPETPEEEVVEEVVEEEVVEEVVEEATVAESETVQEVKEIEEEEDVVSYDELPEGVQKYLDFLEDTGGSLEQFVEINKDLSTLSQDEVIGKFLKAKYPTLDSADIQYEIESRFAVIDTDTDADIRKKNVEKKKFYAEALTSLKSGAEKYKAELGSSKAIPAQAQKALDFVKDLEAQQAQSKVTLDAVRSSFVKETNKVLGKNFKGFEVKIGDEIILYKPENVAKTKEQNMDVNNFLGRFLNKDGSVKDTKGYHKALAIASEPEKFAQHFFELGKARMVEEDAIDSKNVTSGTRGTQPNVKGKQPKFKFLDDGNSSKKGKITLKNY